MTDHETEFLNIDEITQLAEQEGESYLHNVSAAYISLEQRHRERYTQMELIGEGALKQVYSCYDERMRRRVALAKPRRGINPRHYDYFINEAWLTACLQHPNILKVYDLKLDNDGIPYFTMELKGKSTFRSLVERGANLHEGLEVILKVCDALSYAHEAGIIHLDLKPENIMCDPHGEVLLCDWGLGRILPQRQLTDAMVELEALGYLVHDKISGSPGYMAPEQAQNSALDERTDVFSLGCLLYYFALGYPPFVAETTDDIVALTAKAEWNRSALQQSNLPRELQAMIHMALTREPSDRYQSVIEFKQDLLRYLRGYRTHAEQATIWQKSYAFLNRHRTKCAITLTLSLLTIVLTCYYQMQNADLSASKRLIESEKNTLNVALQTLEDEQKQFDANFFGKEYEKELAIATDINKLLDPYYTGYALEYRQRLNRAQRIIKTQPKTQFSQWTRYTIKTIQLDFLSALRIYNGNNNKVKFLKGGTKAQRLLKAERQSLPVEVMEEHPDYQFNYNVRPDAQTLVQLFEELKNAPKKSEITLMSIARYSLCFQYSPEDNNKVLFAALECLMGEDTITSKSDPTNRTTHITLTSFYEPEKHNRFLCLLSYINTGTLNISSESPFKIRNLAGASIRHLDLSRCSVTVDALTPIRHLKSVTIQEGSLDQQTLQNITARGHSSVTINTI